MNRLWPWLLLVFSLPSTADHVPGHARLEWGLGFVALSLPDFRGSSVDQQRLLPFPYLKYRGERLRVDDGIEGRLFKTPDLLLSISGNGSLPSSDDSNERQGMEPLEAIVEIGPSLEYRLYHDTNTSLWLELPVRVALNVEDRLSSVGEVFHPRLAWRRPAPGRYDWKLRVAGGPLFADSDWHGYYYNVHPGEATATRPSYTASGGYSGLRVDFSYSRRINRLWFGGFVRFDSLAGSEIEDSPLVSTTNNLSAGIGLAWIIAEH